MEHLIVGVLLFTPLLALFPTTAAWYLFTTTMHAMTVVVRLSISALGHTLLHNPLYMVFRRALAPRLFPGACTADP